MSWQEIRGLAKKGHEIGSHSMSHGLLPQMSDTELEWELLESHRRLGSAAGEEPKSFCYPNGSYDDRVLRLLRKGPYSNAVTTVNGSHALRDDDYAIRRIHVDSRSFAKGRDGSDRRLAMRMFLASWQ